MTAYGGSYKRKWQPYLGKSVLTFIEWLTEKDCQINVLSQLLIFIYMCVLTKFSNHSSYYDLVVIFVTTTTTTIRLGFDENRKIFNFLPLSFFLILRRNFPRKSTPVCQLLCTFSWMFNSFSFTLNQHYQEINI